MVTENRQLPYTLGGKTVKYNPDRVVIDYVDVPKYFMKLHKFETLVVDVMFLYNTPLLITMSCSIKFVTVEHVPTHTSKKLIKYLKRVMKIYSHISMIVETVIMNMEFYKTIDELIGNFIFNNSNIKEHV